MEPPQSTASRTLSEAGAQPAACREALRLIVEVFRDGHQAAADLRGDLDGLTPYQLEQELEAIERTMLLQIASICDLYGSPTGPQARH